VVALRFFAATVFLLVVVLNGTCAFASSKVYHPVPEASALVLAPMGVAAVVAAERRRRGLVRVKRGVGSIYFIGKRFIDIILASAILLATAPIFAIIALLVRLDSKGPILFKRKVIGLNGQTFYMYKFRSMVEGAEQILAQDENLQKLYRDKWKLENDPRVTRFGKFLRRTSLDELPQLINILLGGMTFVGPRPIAPDEVERYGPAFELFKTVKPGITGIWQTCGRSETSYEKRVEMDMLYIQNRSLLLDLWIIACTIPAVLLKRGAC
jgi:lipopolysaccharide/colanic/teichoic acid biosynthesis glycosyltransferase